MAWKLVKHAAPSLRDRGRQTPSAIKPPQKETVWYCLDGVLAGPLPSSRLVPGPIGLVHVCDLGHKRIIGVRVRQHGADREKDCL